MRRENRYINCICGLDLPKQKWKSALDSQQDLELGEGEWRGREEKALNQKPMWRKPKCNCVLDLLKHKQANQHHLANKDIKDMSP